MAGVRPVSSPVTLRLSGSLIKRSHIKWLALLMLGLLAIMVVPLFALVAGQENGWSGLLDDPDIKMMLWALAVLLPVMGLAFAGFRRAYLRLTPDGLEYFVPAWMAFGRAGQTAGARRFSWQDIRDVRLETPSTLYPQPQTLAAYRLILETAQGELRLSPYNWVDPGSEHRLGLGEILRLRRLGPDRVVRQAPLFRFFQPVDTREVTAASRRSEHFDLTSHRGMMVQLLLLGGAGLYALADTFFLGHWRPLEAMPVTPFILVAVMGLVIVGPLGRGAPRAERLAVALFTVAALTAAVYPGLLRYNAATAPRLVVTYDALEPGYFVTPGMDLPEIDLTDRDLDEYWAEHPAGSRHDFYLLRGKAGFYQLDMMPFYARTRRFYSNR
jgi:hypothetical protein